MQAQQKEKVLCTIAKTPYVTIIFDSVTKNEVANQFKRAAFINNKVNEQIEALERFENDEDFISEILYIIPHYNEILPVIKLPWAYEDIFDRDISTISKYRKFRTIMSNNETNSSIWSKHNQFAPDKRVQFRFVGKMFDVLRQNKREKCSFKDNFFWFLDIDDWEDLFFMNEVAYINSRSFGIRFEGMMYFGDEINATLLRKIRSSFYNQKMGISTALKMSEIMATLTVKVLDIEFEDYGQALRAYLKYFLRYIKSLDVILPDDYILLHTEEMLVCIILNNLPSKFNLEGVDVQEILRFYLQNKKEWNNDDEDSFLTTGNLFGKTCLYVVEKNYSLMLCKDEIEPTVCDKIAVSFVRSLMIGTSLEKAMKNAIKKAKELGYEGVKDMIKKFTSKLFVNDIHTGLFRAGKRLVRESDNIEHFEDLVDEFSLVDYAKNAQWHMITFGKIFGIPVNHYFNTPSFVRLLHATASVNEVQELSWEDYSPLEYLRRKTRQFKEATYDVFSTITSLSKTQAKIEDTMDVMKEQVLKISERMSQKGMIRTAETLMSFDNSSIAGVFASVKGIISSLASEMIKKLGEIFGLTVEVTIDPYTLFLYYMLWISNESRIFRFMIIMDVLAMTGLLDLAWSILQYLFDTLKDVTTTIFCADTETESTIERPIDKFKKSIKKQPIPLVVKPEVSETENGESFIDKIASMLEGNSTKLITTVVVGILGYFGYKNIQTGDVERDFKKFASGVTITALTLGGIPKIFSSIATAVSFVYDQAKSLVVKEHKTQFALLKQLDKFLSSTIYMVGQSEAIFFENESYALGLLKDYNEAIELTKHIHKVKDQTLVSLFRARKRELESLYPSALAGLRTAIADHELFHIQFSSPPGTGKTDLNALVVNRLVKVYDRKMKELLQANDMEDLSDMLPSSNAYPENDTLKHEDNLYEQLISILDEANVSTAMETEVITTKLQIASGKPTITQQAALQNKGRIRPIKMTVSNTNTPFVRPKDMCKPEALWRRRKLVEVRIRSEYAKGEGPNFQVDETKIDPAQRALGMHLQMRWLDELDPSINEHPRSKRSGLGWMNISDFLEWVEVMLEEHFDTEEIRLSTKAPRMNWVRLQTYVFMNLLKKKLITNKSTKEIDQKLKSIREIADKQYAEKMRDLDAFQIKMDDMKKDYEEIEGKMFRFKTNEKGENVSFAEFLEGCGTLKKEECSHKNQDIFEKDTACRNCFENLKKMYDLWIDYYQGVAPVVYNSVLQSEVKAMLGALKEGTDECGYIEDDEFISFKLVKEGDFYYLRKSAEENRIRPGKVDWSKISIQTYESEGVKKKRVVTTDPGEISATMHALLTLSNMDSDEEINLEIKRQRAKTEVAAIKFTFKDYMKRTYYAVKRIMKSAVNYFYEYVFKRIPRAIFEGAALACSVISMFFLLGAIGKFLCAPQVEETSMPGYRQRGATYKTAPKGNVALLKSEEKTSGEYGTLDHISKGQIVLEMTKPDPNNYPGRISSRSIATSITGNIFLINRHVVRGIDSYDRFYVVDPVKLVGDQSEARQQVNIGKIVDLKDTEMSLIEIRDFRTLRHMLKYFVTERDVANHEIDFGNVEARYSTIRPRDGGYELFRSSWSDINYAGDYEFEGGIAKRTYLMSEVEVPMRGDSGSLIIHGNDKKDRPIMGILIGKRRTFFSEGVPLYCIVTQEQLSAGLKQYPQWTTITPCNFIGEASDSPLVRVFKFDNDVSKSYLADQSVSRDSGFRLTGVFKDEIRTYPAVQTPNDPRLPPGERHYLQVSLNKRNNSNQPYFAPDEEDVLIKTLVREMKRGWNWKTARVYDIRTAIVGAKKPGGKPIDIHTSAGIPYKFEPGANGKQHLIYFSVEQNDYVIKERVFIDVEHKLECLKKGIPSGHLKLEFRKHELVKHEKVFVKPKTRTVGTGNITDQVVYDMHNKDIHTAFKNQPKMENPVIPTAFGLNMETDAGKIFGWLKHKKYCCLDVVAWEERFAFQKMRMILTAKTKLLEDAARARGESFDTQAVMNIQLGLAAEWFYGSVVFEDIIFTGRGGLESGWPGTFPDNSWAHRITIKTVFKRLFVQFIAQIENDFSSVPFKETTHKEAAIQLLHAGLEPEKVKIWYRIKTIGVWNFVEENVESITAADDVIISISELLEKVFTANDIARGYRKCGYEVTAADKTQNFKLVDLEEVEFLKHTFEKQGDKIIAKPKESIIFQLLCYYRTDTKLTKMEQIIENINNAMRFAYWHGQAYYENLSERVNEEFAKMKIRWVKTYDSMRSSIEQDISSQEALKTGDLKVLEFLEMDD